MLLCLSTTSTFSQQYDAIINENYHGNIDIYDGPFGKVIQSVKNDTSNGNTLHLVFLDESDSCFYVRIETASLKDKPSGWIRKADYIGAYKSGAKDDMEVVVYETRMRIKHNKITVSHWKPEFLTIHSKNRDSMLVSIQRKNKRIQAWISEKELCYERKNVCAAK